MKLKRLSPRAVNAIGMAAEDPASGRRLVWLFNTDGTDAPVRETNLGGALAGDDVFSMDTRVEVISWHGFGDVVTPAYWSLLFNMEEDRLLLCCGMRKETGCPLVEKKGLIRHLLGSITKTTTTHNNNGDIKCYLVALLQDSRATIIELEDW